MICRAWRSCAGVRIDSSFALTSFSISASCFCCRAVKESSDLTNGGSTWPSCGRPRPMPGGGPSPGGPSPGPLPRSLPPGPPRGGPSGASSGGPPPRAPGGPPGPSRPGSPRRPPCAGPGSPGPCIPWRPGRSSERSRVPSRFRSSDLRAAAASRISAADSSPSRSLSSATIRGGGGGIGRSSPAPSPAPGRGWRPGRGPSSGGPESWARTAAGARKTDATNSRRAIRDTLISGSPSKVNARVCRAAGSSRGSRRDRPASVREDCSSVNLKPP